LGAAIKEKIKSDECCNSVNSKIESAIGSIKGFASSLSSSCSTEKGEEVRSSGCCSKEKTEKEEKDSNCCKKAEVATNKIVSKAATAILPNLVWAHFLGVLEYWLHDSSPNFEKTDRFIEKTTKVVQGDLSSITPRNLMSDLASLFGRSSNP
jgi:hypothetical protein